MSHSTSNLGSLLEEIRAMDKPSEPVSDFTDPFAPSA